MASRMNKTIVFDMHGIIYSHDKNSSIKNSKNKFNSIVSEQNHNTEQKELTFEFDSISKALNHHQNELNIYPMSGAIEKILFHIRNQDKIIIISTSLVKTQKLILKTFLKDEKLLDNIYFYNSSEFGSKSDPETWHQILQKYKHISELYEDTQEYLDAAQYAVTQLGHKFCQFSNKL
jgi:hypothetical protein